MKNIFLGQTSSYKTFASLQCYHLYKVLIRSDFRQKDMTKSGYLNIKVTLSDLQ